MNTPSLKHQLACLWFSWAHRSRAACAIVSLAKHRSISPLLWFTVQGLHLWIECCIQHLRPLLSQGTRYTRHLSWNTTCTGVAAAVLVQEREVTLRKFGPSAPVFLNVFKQITCFLTVPVPLAVKKGWWTTNLIKGTADQGVESAAKELNFYIITLLAAKWPVKLSEMSRRNRRQNHRMDDVGKDLEIISSVPCAQAGSARAGCLGLCLAGFWISAGMETPKPLRAPCSIVWPPTQLKSVFLSSDGISCICSHCILCHVWSPYTPEQPVSPRWGLHVTRFDLNLSVHLWNPSIHSLSPCWSLSMRDLATFAWRPVSACWTNGLTASHLLEMLWHHPRAQHS